MHAGRGRAGRWAVLAGLLLLLAPSPATASTFPLPTSPATGATARGRPAGAPTAAVGDFDCDRLRVEIRLDNTRSTQAVRYRYRAAFVRPLRAPYSGADEQTDLEVAAGATRLIALPVRDDARTDLTVFLPDGGHLYSSGSCGNAPNAISGLGDCEALRLPLTLDNSTSHLPTRYRWTVRDPGGPVATDTVVVAAGGTVDVDLPLVADSWAEVGVTVDGRGAVASVNRQTCGRVVLDPRAAFGALDCDDVSAPVLLDNSRTTARLRFHLPGQVVVLGPGETRSLRLHLPIRTRLAVTVDDVLPEGEPVDRATVSTAHCAAALPIAGTATAGSPTTGAPAAAASEGTVGGQSAVGGRSAAGRPAAVTASETGPDAASRQVLAATGSSPSSVVVAAGVLLTLVVGLVMAMRRRRSAT